MRNSNGQNDCNEYENNLANSHCKIIENLKNKETLLPSQLKLIDMIMSSNINELLDSLKLIYEVALYHSEIAIETKEKIALFYLKKLTEQINDIAIESK